MQWTDDKTAALKMLWEKGSVASEIANILGTTRNAVIGKAHRLNCAPRNSGRLNSISGQVKSHIKRPRMTHKQLLERILREMGPENPTTLEQLTPTQCKFPRGGEKDPVESFCGRERWAGTRKFAPHYCKYHVYVAAKLEDPGRPIRP